MTQLIEPSLARQFDMLPPHSIEAEMCVLASMMIDSGMCREAQSIIVRDDFYQVDHQIIFDAVVKLNDRAKVDSVLLFEELTRTGLIEEVGGRAYIAQILNSVPSAAHGMHYANIVREKSMLRKLATQCNQVLRRVYSQALPESAAEIIGEVCAEMALLNRASARGEGTKTIGDILAGVRAQMANGEETLIPTGFRDIDSVIGGIGPGEMWLIGARPSMGKSMLAKQIALRAARNMIPVAFFSLEESGFKIGRNLISSEAEIENNRLRKPSGLHENDWREMDLAIDRMDNLPIYVNDRLRSVPEIRSECASLVARHGIKLALFDYLQLVDGGGKTPYERASEASKGIAQIIRDLQIGGLVTVQLKRFGERPDKHPDMTDLRDSGQIEQDADGIFLLHREDYYHLNDADYIQTHMAELNLAKVRDGERGITIQLESKLRFQTFGDRYQHGGNQ